MKTVKTRRRFLLLHFTANGFKKQRDLDLERRYFRVRYRKRAEYIPLPSEIGRMVTAGRTQSEKALVIFACESGLRTSTARAVRYADIKDGLDVVHVPVRSGIKEVDLDGAKAKDPHWAHSKKEGLRAPASQRIHVQVSSVVWFAE
jgi:hypothetical protein